MNAAFLALWVLVNAVVGARLAGPNGSADARWGALVSAVLGPLGWLVIVCDIGFTARELGRRRQ